MFIFVLGLVYFTEQNAAELENHLFLLLLIKKIAA